MTETWPMDPIMRNVSSNSREQLIAQDSAAAMDGSESPQDGRDKSGGAGEAVRTAEAPAQTHNGHGDPPVYRTYKRRWFGLVQLILLNIVVSWDWLTYAPVANTAAVFFNTTPTIVNWLGVGFFFAFGLAAPFSYWALHASGPKRAIGAAAALLLVGNWVRYGATRATPPSYTGVMVGQVLIGGAQPFVLAAPTRYSDLWFSARGRIAATAVATLANPFGAALGQLVDPFLVAQPADIAPLTLYVAVITTVACVPAFFIPAAPPTPVAASATVARPPVRAQLALLARNPTVWLVLLPFAVFVGFFNSFSTLLTQILTPHGFSESDAGIAGALLILVGLVATAVAAPILDRTKAYLLAIKSLLPLAAACYLAFIWAPQAPSIVAADVICAVLGAASFVILPTALEFLAEASWPVGPELTSVIGWTAGQLLGAVFLLISGALRDGADGQPPYNMRRALIFEAAVAIAVVPSALIIGWVGDTKSKRVDAEREGRERFGM